ncbi:MULTISPECIES: NUDIX hydrolase [Glutamicibacter]|uniref:NUDIX domain-containing protein n=1 Tax=Glutamicibacter halophytocola TaxID=1933880 RepID=A0A5B8IYZ8_9MICC|nr:NUDIX domain-containing protein [Glutamicibacter halophytocola]MBF6672676.1 NUDIX domain-containing protein [Glutamicibacter sp. FBE19]NQD39564.1 NUDIX domain-containing protein [Glutamicibacter halophytocola]QDY67397.1 NUDIX domain-containing protein [Glutamicibacter halophytocola]UUX59579.1 NUDIX domain-containing protein [Glutamicibacter halophytocola]
MKKNLTISAVCLINNQGQILLVRKRGTSKFMQPGGKPEFGESPLQTVIREIHEELGIQFAAEDLDFNGVWVGPAANEDQTSIHASLFTAHYDGTLSPLAELEELLWIMPEDAMKRDDLAPLLREHVLPQLIKRASS